MYGEQTENDVSEEEQIGQTSVIKLWAKHTMTLIRFVLLGFNVCVTLVQWVGGGGDRGRKRDRRPAR